MTCYNDYLKSDKILKREDNGREKKRTLSKRAQIKNTHIIPARRDSKGPWKGREP